MKNMKFTCLVIKRFKGVNVRGEISDTSDFNLHVYIYIYIYIYIYTSPKRMDLALNNLQRLICH